jgi:hypothetical protein
MDRSNFVLYCKDYDGQGATRPRPFTGLKVEGAHLEGVLPISFWRRRSAAVSAAACSITAKPVEFRALIWKSGLLRVGHPRSVPLGQHALDTAAP